MILNTAFSQKASSPIIVFELKLTAAKTGGGIVPPPVFACQKSIFDTLSNETHFVGLSFEKAAARRSALASLARLRAEKYFCRRTRRRQKCFALYLRLRAQTLRGFFGRLSSPVRARTGRGCFVLKRAAEREIALAMRGRKIYNGKRISRIEKMGDRMPL